jgi:prefoldin subunit 5
MKEDITFILMVIYAILNLGWGWYIYRRIEEAIKRAKTRFEIIEKGQSEIKTVIENLR